MPIDLSTKNTEKGRRVEEYFRDKPPVKEEKKSRQADEEESKKITRDVIFSWRAPEFEPFVVDKKAYLIATAILAAVIIYALVTNSPIMAITFILIGIVGYLYLQKEPKLLDIAITSQGVVVGNEIYELKNISSFWIFYEPPQVKILSLHLKDKILPHVHIPIYKENPVKIREALLDFIPEEEQEMTVIDNIERIFHR